MFHLRNCIIVSIAFTIQTLTPISLHAQDAGGCDLAAELPSQRIMIDNSWKGMTFDGGEGTDSFNISGPSYFLPRPGRFISVEIFNLENGLFDTIIVNAEMIQTTEHGEIEIFADWFDQVVLDPEVSWTRSLDDAFSSQIFTTVLDGQTLKVRAGLNTHILAKASLPLETKEGPLGVFERQDISSVSLSARQVDANDADAMIKPHYPNSTIVMPNMLKLGDDIKRIELNSEGGFPNVVLIDINKINLSTSRELIFRGDHFDRLMLAQPGCWEISDTATDGQKIARYTKDPQIEITLLADSHHLNTRRIGRYTVGYARAPGYRHLSADSRHVVDQINLENGGPDVFILRNSAHLRPDVPVIVRGDSGQDQIWLEGTAGWRIEYQDRGVVARVPFGSDSEIILAFMPGLKVSILPAPGFLSDPAMLELPAYPGLADEITNHTTLIVTRAGFVKFSENQMTNIERVEFGNGIANTVQISPDMLAGASQNLRLQGDQGLDTLLLIGMPDFVTDASGALIWKIAQPDGTVQTVTANGFSYLAQPNPK